MTTFAIDGSWNQIKGKLRQQFGQLTDDDVSFVEGKGDELLGRLQSKLGMGADQLNDLLNELKDELSAAGANGHEGVASLKAAAGRLADNIKGQAGDVYEQTRQKARTLHEDAEEYVRRNPRQALLTAIAAGFVAGLLIRR